MGEVTKISWADHTFTPWIGELTHEPPEAPCACGR